MESFGNSFYITEKLFFVICGGMNQPGTSLRYLYVLALFKIFWYISCFVYLLALLIILIAMAASQMSSSDPSNHPKVLLIQLATLTHTHTHTHNAL